MELEIRDVIGNVPLDFLRKSVENMEVKFIKWWALMQRFESCVINGIVPVEIYFCFFTSTRLSYRHSDIKIGRDFTATL